MKHTHFPDPVMDMADKEVFFAICGKMAPWDEIMTYFEYISCKDCVREVRLMAAEDWNRLHLTRRDELWDASRMTEAAHGRHSQKETS